MMRRDCDLLAISVCLSWNITIKELFSKIIRSIQKATVNTSENAPKRRRASVQGT